MTCRILTTSSFLGCGHLDPNLSLQTYFLALSQTVLSWTCLISMELHYDLDSHLSTTSGSASGKLRVMGWALLASVETPSHCCLSFHQKADLLLLLPHGFWVYLCISTPCPLPLPFFFSYNKVNCILKTLLSVHWLHRNA